MDWCRGQRLRLYGLFLPSRMDYFRSQGGLCRQYFVWLDITSSSVQLVGGTMVSMNSSASITLDGTHVYMGGVGMQKCFILCFTALAIAFHRRMSVLESKGETAGRTGWRKLLFTLYVVLILITVSSCISVHIALLASTLLYPIFSLVFLDRQKLPSHGYDSICSLVFDIDSHYLPPRRMFWWPKSCFQSLTLSLSLFLLFGRPPSICLYGRPSSLSTSALYSLDQTVNFPSLLARRRRNGRGSKRKRSRLERKKRSPRKRVKLGPKIQ